MKVHLCSHNVHFFFRFWKELITVLSFHMILVALGRVIDGPLGYESTAEFMWH